MRSNIKIIQVLNEVLTYELTSINQYFLHARMFKNWGIEGLNSKAYKKSIKDMKQADELIERILMLEGLPNLQMLGRLNIGEEPKEMIACDTKFEQDQLPLMRKAIDLCETEQDYVSRDLLTSILHYEEEYLDWLETQQYQIDTIGIEKYLQSQLGDK
jgi:bacterioferritin